MSKKEVKEMLENTKVLNKKLAYLETLYDIRKDAVSNKLGMIELYYRDCYSIHGGRTLLKHSERLKEAFTRELDVIIKEYVEEVRSAQEPVLVYFKGE